MTAKSTAPAFLEAAAKHMRDRAAAYDKPEGERSMAKTVKAFNAITGRDLSTAEGWLLLQVLKQVRVFTNPTAPHQDSLEDSIAYGALLAEEMLGEEEEPAIPVQKEPTGHRNLMERVMQKAEEAVQSACKAPAPVMNCTTCAWGSALAGNACCQACGGFSGGYWKWEPNAPTPVEKPLGREELPVISKLVDRNCRTCAYFNAPNTEDPCLACNADADDGKGAFTRWGPQP